MPAWSVDGMDVRAVAETARRAVDAMRAGGGPHFLEARTYRFRAHSMFDPERYRDKAEVQVWRERDPVDLFTAALRGEGVLDDATLQAMEDEIAAEIEDAVQFAEQSPDEDVADLLRFVYSPTSTAAGRSS